MDKWPEHLRVLVCGGRNFANRVVKGDEIAKREHYFIFSALDKIALEHAKATGVNTEDNWLPYWTVISGGAKGADNAGEDWAVINWTQLEIYPADWEKYGTAAGIIRNIQMLKEGKPDLVVAFPGGRGTAHMVKIAKEAGIPVREIAYDPQRGDCLC